MRSMSKLFQFLSSGFHKNFLGFYIFVPLSSKKFFGSDFIYKPLQILFVDRKYLKKQSSQMQDLFYILSSRTLLGSDTNKTLLVEKNLEKKKSNQKASQIQNLFDLY
ncbi:hypothetical protein BpHYR1_032707 [Brachionus plicatilis]|uniref:Uncharacterized protein n=1 Tax=Brachionus plicatilis TaxID=10195 RepID=A0A3M7Q4S5_BRAPC|nr:hypothetical protein BpHYR1_032707 [Brachionus plicatilis]